MSILPNRYRGYIDPFELVNSSLLIGAYAHTYLLTNVPDQSKVQTYVQDERS